MKVFYDHQVFEVQSYGGASRYFYEIIERNRNRYEAEIALRRSQNQYIDKIRSLEARKVNRAGFLDDFFFGLQFRGKERIYRARNRLFPLMNAAEQNRKWSIKMLRDGGFDLVHPTYYDPYFLDALGGRPFVVTVHDFVHEVFPEFFDPRDPTPIHKKALIDSAKCIIAVSQKTKDDIIKFCGTEPSRIDVIYHGSSFEADATSKVAHKEVALPESYLLFVGRRNNYKNFEFLAEAFGFLLKKFPDIYLLCAGLPFNARETRYFDNLDISQRVLSFQADDAMLKMLYSRALALVIPSLYEGFGIPILEAFACGCPVAASSSSCLPEIAGDAAQYFNPKEIDEMLGVLEAFVEDSSLRIDLTKKGHERLRLFSWEKAADETFRVYQKALA